MDQDQLRSDLRFVRAIVDGHDRDNSPALIFFLWAVVGTGRIRARGFLRDVGTCELEHRRTGWVSGQRRTGVASRAT